MQITLISLRILVGYAKSTHRSLAQLCRVPFPLRPGDARYEADVDFTHDPTRTPSGGEPALFQIGDRDDRDGQDRIGGLPWDPLAPRLLQEVQRLANEGKDRPFTAAVVLAAALPFSGAAFFFGTPVLAGDAALQWGAGTPIGRTVGQGTKNAVEVRCFGFAWATAGLLWAQTTLRTVHLRFVYFVTHQGRLKCFLCISRTGFHSQVRETVA